MGGSHSQDEKKTEQKGPDYPFTERGEHKAAIKYRTATGIEYEQVLFKEDAGKDVVPRNTDVALQQQVPGAPAGVSSSAPPAAAATAPGQQLQPAGAPPAQSSRVTETGFIRPRVLVLFASFYGHVQRMAEAVAEGAQSAGAEVTIKRVPETLSDEMLAKMRALDSRKSMRDIPVATVRDLLEFDAIVFGSPARFGNVCAEMREFLDATGPLWVAGGLIGKVASAFTCTATQHGGQESTLLSLFPTLLHQGMIVVGLPYAFHGQFGVEEVKGCSPYGATTIAGALERQPADGELDGARFQGRYVADIAAKLLNQS
eukprot:tig00020965_g16851.t1